MKVTKARFRVQSSYEKGYQPWKRVKFFMPPEMFYRNLDIFIMDVNPETLKADIKLKRKKVKKAVALELNVAHYNDHFVVIIEPENKRCLYSKIL
jgi:hypothetical protein